MQKQTKNAAVLVPARSRYKLLSHPLGKASLGVAWTDLCQCCCLPLINAEVSTGKASTSCLGQWLELSKALNVYDHN